MLLYALYGKKNKTILFSLLIKIFIGILFAHSYESYDKQSIFLLKANNLSMWFKLFNIDRAEVYKIILTGTKSPFLKFSPFSSNSIIQSATANEFNL